MLTTLLLLPIYVARSNPPRPYDATFLNALFPTVAILFTPYDLRETCSKGRLDGVRDSTIERCLYADFLLPMACISASQGPTFFYIQISDLSSSQETHDDTYAYHVCKLEEKKNSHQSPDSYFDLSSSLKRSYFLPAEPSPLTRHNPGYNPTTHPPRPIPQPNPKHVLPHQRPSQAESNDRPFQPISPLQNKQIPPLQPPSDTSKPHSRM